MNSFLVSLVHGNSIEVEADFYGQEGDDFVFTGDGVEVKRIRMFEVGSITKAK